MEEQLASRSRRPCVLFLCCMGASAAAFPNLPYLGLTGAHRGPESC